MKHFSWTILIIVFFSLVINFHSFSQAKKEDLKATSVEAAEEVYYKVEEKEVKPDLEYIYRGPFAMAKIGPSVHVKSSVTDISLDALVGYQINRSFSAGLGIEVFQYSNSNFNLIDVTAYPIYFDARFYLRKGKIQPMFNVDLGYSFFGESGYTETQKKFATFIPSPSKGGAFLSMGAGLRAHVNEILSVVVDGGYAVQTFKGYKYSKVYDHNTGEFVEVPEAAKELVSSLRLNVGVAFNLLTKNVR